MKTYTLYLSTLTANGKYVPTSKSNLANVKWSINWKEIFGNRNGECRVRIKFITSPLASANLTDKNYGSIRASFSSNCSNSTNGFNLGCVDMELDTKTDDGTPTNVMLNSDSLLTNGATIIIPNSNGDFTISLYDNTETLMTFTNAPEYQIWFYFDVDDETPFISNEALPKFYNPR